MIVRRSTVLLVVLGTMIASSLLAASGENQVPTEGVIHTTVDRLAGPALDPELLGRTTDASDAEVSALQDRLLHGRQHPEAGPPFKTVELDAASIAPFNEPTDPLGADGGSAGPLVVFVNSTPSNAAPSGYSSTVNEPAVAAAGERVFYTANWYAATSDDGGANFSFVNPYPGPFPAPTGESFCCDQTMTHDPGSNTIFWLQQFYPTGATNTGTQRINVDRNSDGSWDCAYDINTILVGYPVDTWFDFPDLTISSNYLYHASNAFTFSDGWAGAYAGRYPLAELAACSTPLTIDGFRTLSWGSFRFSRGAGDTMYFAALPSNNSVRIWSWPDAEPGPVSVSRSVTPWLNGSRVCPGPDGRNWCGFHDGRIQSGFLSGSTVGFMWTPSQGGGFPNPYVRVSTFDAADSLSPVDDIDIWSSDVAYMYPSSSVNSAGQLGGTVMWGGGPVHYASCSAWMADTPTVGDLIPLDQVTSIAGTVGPNSSNGRSGDYTVTTTYYPNDLQFAGSCFAYLSAVTGTSTYVRFGRAGSGEEIFANGLESGDTAAWSIVVP